MHVSLTRRGMTSFDATRLSAKEEQQMLRAIGALDLSFNSIAFVKGMQSLGKLTDLNLAHNCLDSLDRLPLCLRRLDVSFNNLTVLTGIAALSQLQYINCSHNALTNLQGLPSSSPLRIVNASHNRLSSCRGLEHCVGLSELDVSGNLLADASHLSFLKSIHSLRVLDVADNPFTHRTMNKGMQELRAQLPRIDVIRSSAAVPGRAVGSPSQQRQGRQAAQVQAHHHASQPSSVSYPGARASSPQAVESALVASTSYTNSRRATTMDIGARSTSSAGGGPTPDASLIAPAATEGAPSLQREAASDTAMMEAVTARAQRDDLRLEVASLKSELAEERRARAILQDELEAVRRELDTLRRSVSSVQHAKEEPSGRPRDGSTSRTPRIDRESTATPRRSQQPVSARASLSAAVAALTESRSRLGATTPAQPPPGGGVTRSANIRVNHPQRPSAPDTASSLPLGQLSSAANGVVMSADRRRPLSADSRRPPSSSSTLRNAAMMPLIIAPLPSLQRSASADHRRPRSADTSVATTHKSVSFGPNQYFSPPHEFRQ